MHRRTMLSLAGTLAAAALSGCIADRRERATARSATGSSEAPHDETPRDPTTDTPTAGAELPTGEPAVDDERLATRATGTAAFALDLHDRLVADQGGNVFTSPYSVSVALAMVYAGARGATRKELRETLHYRLDDEVHRAVAAVRDALSSRATATDPLDDEGVPSFRLATANAPWGREGFPFADDYLDLLAEQYDADLRRADFIERPSRARDRINDWVAGATDGQVVDLLPPGAIDASTVLVLTNAVSFAAGWLHQFDPEKTAAGTFTALDGTASTVPFMRQQLRTNYASVPGAQVVELPYVGESVSMVLILPDRGTFERFERTLDAGRLFGLFEELSDAAGVLALPRFEFSTGTRLSETLSALGMPRAFDDRADFSGLTAGDGSELRLDEVFHEAFVSVDEEGTEAAASTAAVVVESMPAQWGELRFDRPFLFCIRDRPTGTVLFLGRVVDAAAARPKDG